MSIIFYFCIGGILLLGALAGFGFGITALRRNQAAEDYPTADGVVTRSAVEEYLTYDTAPATRMYRLDFAYEFQVDGATYTGSHLGASPNASLNSRRKQEERLAPYPAGQRVTVYYNPLDPADALLEINPAPLNAGIIVGAVCALALLVLLGAFAVEMLRAVF